MNISPSFLAMVQLTTESKMAQSSIKLFFVTFGLLSSQLVAFSTTNWARHNNIQYLGGVIREEKLWNKHQRQQSVCLHAETTRRGFIGACATAAAACSVVAVSPAKSMTQTDANPAINSNLQAGLTSIDGESIEKSLTALQESISGFVSGTAVSTVKTLVKYPLDTATVRLQMPDTPFTIRNLSTLFDGSFQGISGPLISNIPAGAIFFAVKDATKSALKGSDLGLPKWASTSIAVAAALPPYWLIRNPSEVVKTRLQVGAEGYYEGMSTLDAFKLALSSGGSDNSTLNGVRDLYQGYSENILYGFPADIIKFVAYDYLSGGKKKVSPSDGAIYGALATALAQLLTTPLDVVRNRIMADVATSSSTAKADASVELSYIERLTKIAKEEGVGELFAGTSPRIAKAMLSGALQFAAYEETKQKISDMFMKR